MWRSVADQLRRKVPRLAALMDSAEDDVLAYTDFPREHRAKIHWTNPIECLNGEIKRRTDVAGIFPMRPPSSASSAPTCSSSPMGDPARPLHDPGDHRRSQRYCPRQPACRGRL